MTPDDFIHRAIDQGRSSGLGGLSPLARAVFLVSEAEVLCDMEGIDSFLDRYDPSVVREAAAAFRAIDATEIAVALTTIADALPERHEADLAEANRLITSRSGYDYRSIERVVANEFDAAPA